MPARTPLRVRFSQSDPELAAAEYALDEAFSPLLESPLARVSLLRANVFTAGVEVQLVHKLGVVPAGWLCVDAVGAVFAGYRVAWDAKTLTLHPTTSCSATLLVF